MSKGRRGRRGGRRRRPRKREQPGAERLCEGPLGLTPCYLNQGHNGECEGVDGPCAVEQRREVFRKLGQKLGSAREQQIIDALLDGTVNAAPHARAQP